MKKFIIQFVGVVIGLRALVCVFIARLSGGGVALLVGSPIHGNLGDQAIALAQVRFVQGVKGFRVVELDYVDLKSLRMMLGILSRAMRSTDLVFTMGGGNLGDQYPDEEDVRRLAIDIFPSNRVVVFPQTFFFKDSIEARGMLADTEQLYSKHKYLTIVAREQASYESMLKSFPSNKVILSPDIVLSMKVAGTGVARAGAMTCLRSDVEKSIDDSYEGEIINMLKSRFGSVHVSDTVVEGVHVLTGGYRKRLLNRKWAEFMRAEVVVTDRLHGMVFAAITKTPCVVFTNYNHKVSGTYEWIKDLPYIRLCTDINELSDLLDEVVSASLGDPVELSHEFKGVAGAVRGD